MAPANAIRGLAGASADQLEHRSPASWGLILERLPRRGTLPRPGTPPALRVTAAGGRRSTAPLQSCGAGALAPGRADWPGAAAQADSGGRLDESRIMAPVVIGPRMALACLQMRVLPSLRPDLASCRPRSGRSRSVALGPEGRQDRRWRGLAAGFWVPCRVREIRSSRSAASHTRYSYLATRHAGLAPPVVARGCGWCTAAGSVRVLLRPGRVGGRRTDLTGRQVYKPANVSGLPPWPCRPVRAGRGGGGWRWCWGRRLGGVSVRRQRVVAEGEIAGHHW